MTKQEFIELTKNITLLDGATGSNLLASGMPRGICTETWILEHKDVILNLQRAYVDAGSKIIYAPTFGANRINLTMHGLQDRIEEINTKMVAYAKEAADGRAYVAGDITTSGKLMGADESYMYEHAFQMYQEQIQFVVNAGVDLIVAETMINIDETLAAIDAANSFTDIPIICTVTVDADGSIYSGGNAIDAAVAFESAGASAVGINCSVGPDQLVSVVRNIKEAVSIPVIAKPNAGMPVIDEQGRAVYNMQADVFAKHMKVLTENGATIIGGCCGTTPEYIRETANLLGIH